MHHVLWCIVLFARKVEQEGFKVAISSLTVRADDSELSKRATEVNKDQQDTKKVLPTKRLGLYQ